MAQLAGRSEGSRNPPVSLTHSVRVRSGRLEGRAVLQGVRLPGDDDLKETGHPLHPYPISRPAGDSAVVHVVLRCVIQSGAVPVSRDQAERFDLRVPRDRHVHQLPGVVECPVEGRGRRFRLYAADQRDRFVLQGADHLGGRAVLADRCV